MPRPPAGLRAVAATLLVAALGACGGPVAPSAPVASGTPAGVGSSSPSPSRAPARTAAGASAPAPSPIRSAAASTSAPGPTQTATPRPTPVATPNYQAGTDLRIGDCYDPIEDADDGALLAASVMPCASPHRHEVFGVGALDSPADAPLPAPAELGDHAEELCDAAFETYVGLPWSRSRFRYVYYAPTALTWAGGDREVLCVIDHGDSAFTGSIRGARQ